MAQDGDAGNHGSHGCSAARIEGIYDGAVLDMCIRSKRQYCLSRLHQKKIRLHQIMQKQYCLISRSGQRLCVDRQAGKGNARNH